MTVVQKQLLSLSDLVQNTMLCNIKALQKSCEVQCDVDGGVYRWDINKKLAGYIDLKHNLFWFCSVPKRNKQTIMDHFSRHWRSYTKMFLENNDEEKNQRQGGAMKPSYL